jgi:hypothetical protein
MIYFDSLSLSFYNRYSQKRRSIPSATRVFRGVVKVKFFLCMSLRPVVGVELYLQAFLTCAELHAPAALRLQKDLPVPIDLEIRMLRKREKHKRKLGKQ